MFSQKLWYLKQIDLFRDLSEPDLKKVSLCFVHKMMKRGQMIARLDEQGGLYLIKKGVVELYSVSRDGKKVIIDVLGPGSLFGSIKHNPDFSLEARVRQDALVCRSQVSDFFVMISQYPRVAEKLLKELYEYSLRQQQQIASLATQTVPERLLRLLRMLSQKFWHKQMVGFTHEDLAQMIGASRQTVSSLLTELIKQGVVVKEGKNYRVIETI